MNRSEVMRQLGEASILMQARTQQFTAVQLEYGAAVLMDPMNTTRLMDFRRRVHDALDLVLDAQSSVNYLTVMMSKTLE